MLLVCVSAFWRTDKTATSITTTTTTTFTTATTTTAALRVTTTATHCMLQHAATPLGCHFPFDMCLLACLLMAQPRTR